MTEKVQTRRRHHRRGPAKRFLLAAGPFCILTAAFLLSAGIVKIVEQPPKSRPAPTLADERRMGLGRILTQSMTKPRGSARLQSLTSVLLTDEESERSAATGFATQRDAQGVPHDFGVAISAPSGIAPEHSARSLPTNDPLRQSDPRPAKLR